MAVSIVTSPDRKITGFISFLQFFYWYYWYEWCKVSL